MDAEHTGLALSIRQPHLENILSGSKTHEYRTRATRIRGTVWLYAALTLDGPGDVLAHLPRGLIVGEACIVDCVEGGPRGWQWRLVNPRRLPRPLRFHGQPMPVFWRPRRVWAP